MDSIHQVRHDVHTHHLPEPNHSTFKLALSATFHCLLGCGLGEISGMIISAAAGLNNVTTIVLSLLLGFIGGLLLGILPLRKSGFNFKKAVKTVVIGEGLSILVMETFEIITEVSIPGLMNAHLSDSLFWWGMLAALVAGFITALPVNYALIKRGITHIHS